jgi:hypothetical protein
MSSGRGVVHGTRSSNRPAPGGRRCTIKAHDRIAHPAAGCRSLGSQIGLPRLRSGDHPPARSSDYAARAGEATPPYEHAPAAGRYVDHDQSWRGERGARGVHPVTRHRAGVVSAAPPSFPAKSGPLRRPGEAVVCRLVWKVLLGEVVHGCTGIGLAAAAVRSSGEGRTSGGSGGVGELFDLVGEV